MVPRTLRGWVALVALAVAGACDLNPQPIIPQGAVPAEPTLGGNRNAGSPAGASTGGTGADLGAGAAPTTSGGMSGTAGSSAMDAGGSPSPGAGGEGAGGAGPEPAGGAGGEGGVR